MTATESHTAHNPGPAVFGSERLAQLIVAIGEGTLERERTGERPFAAVDLVREHELSEFEIEHDGLRVKVRKNGTGGAGPGIARFRAAQAMSGGMTALLFAARENKAEMVRFLLDEDMSDELEWLRSFRAWVREVLLPIYRDQARPD